MDLEKLEDVLLLNETIYIRGKQRGLFLGASLVAQPEESPLMSSSKSHKGQRTNGYWA